MPKVSVLMSIYRPDEGYLAEQLETIDAQDFADAEVVVYNDCPKDVSWEAFCRAHVTRHAMRYVHGDQNRGYVKAFEHLVGLAQGSYIAFCDQDDRWLPGRLSEAVALLDEGYQLVCCDRQTIDGEGRVTCESWRAAHADDESLTWANGESITSRAAFTCYAIGMATMVRTEVACALVPFPTCTGHDKWLALGASAMGPCANIEQPLVQYRLHGTNQTGVLRGIDSKRDWYEHRIESTCELVDEFARRFPDSPDLAEMRAFSEARKHGDIVGIWRHRHLAPQVARFEMLMNLTPDWLFRSALRVLRRKG